MSKIVITGNKIKAPQVMADLFDRLKNDNPVDAEAMAGMDKKPLIRECAKNAIRMMTENFSDIKNTDRVKDWHGNAITSYEGKPLIGAVKTKVLEKGIGVIIQDSGELAFVADDFKPEWKKEIKRLTEIFTDFFLLESNKAYLEIFGEYEVEVRKKIIKDEKTGDSRAIFHIHAERVRGVAI